MQHFSGMRGILCARGWWWFGLVATSSPPSCLLSCPLTGGLDHYIYNESSLMTMMMIIIFLFTLRLLKIKIMVAIIADLSNSVLRHYLFLIAAFRYILFPIADYFEIYLPIADHFQVYQHQQPPLLSEQREEKKAGEVRKSIDKRQKKQKDNNRQQKTKTKTKTKDKDKKDKDARQRRRARWWFPIFNPVLPLRKQTILRKLESFGWFAYV